MHLLAQSTVGIFGFGYTAQVFSKILIKHGINVLGTSRNPTLQATYNSPSIQVIDYNLANAKRILESCDAILISIPPTDGGLDPVLTILLQQGLFNSSQHQWIGYLSSTSVYGDHQGKWVTETSACVNPGDTGQNRLSAEKAWLSLYSSHNLPIHVFRLAGIYGPGRSSLERIGEGKDFSVIKPGHFFSRIHVEDISNALWHSLQSPMPGEIFNVCDDCPAATEDVDAYAAALLNKPALKLIPYDQANLSPMGLSFYQSNKRVSNKKLKEKLNLTLLYPSYKEGLTQIYLKSLEMQVKSD